MTYEIVQLPRDDDNVRAWVERYKEFRLLSLKTAPEAFGSTYAREIAFTDDVWYDRLANPKATTLVTQLSDHTVCSLTAMGPLPFAPEESPPSKNPWTTLSGESPKNLPLHWRINGVFTLPEARGQGLAKALIERVIKLGADEAAKSGVGFAFSIVVGADNTSARALYTKCGFQCIREEMMPGDRPRVVILMKYKP